MILSTFEQIMREHMNYSDMATIKAIAEATDNNQNQILVALTSKLYEMIVAKVTKLDYSSVASSRGDITKIQNYNELVETVNIIRQLVAEYKCDVTPVQAVEKAFDNVKARTATFKKAFVIGASVPMVLYNSIVVDIIAAVSYMVDTCIEYIKNPQSQSFQMAMDVVAYSKTRDCLMYETLMTFNDGCASGDIDEALKVSLNRSRVKREAAEGVNEGYGFNNPDNFTLRLVQSCVKAIRKGREKGISNDDIERQVTNIIEKRLNSTDMGAMMISANTYGLSTANLSHSTAMLRNLQNLSLKNVQNMEQDYNATHMHKRTYAQTYKNEDIELIKKCAKEVRKNKFSVTKESMMDERVVDELKSLMNEWVEEFVDRVDVPEVKYDSPFMSDEDINSGTTVVHDDDCATNEAFDGVVSILGRGLIAICKLVVPLIRQVVYMYFFSRQRISDYFESQAIAIEMNAYQLQYNSDMDPDRRQEIYNKQMHIAEKLRKKAMRTSIDYKRARKDVDKEIAQEQKKFTVDELEYNPNDNNLDGTSNASVLF